MSAGRATLANVIVSSPYSSLSSSSSSSSQSLLPLPLPLPLALLISHFHSAVAADAAAGAAKATQTTQPTLLAGSGRRQLRRRDLLLRVLDLLRENSGLAVQVLDKLHASIVLNELVSDDCCKQARESGTDVMSLQSITVKH